MLPIFGCYTGMIRANQCVVAPYAANALWSPAIGFVDAAAALFLLSCNIQCSPNHIALRTSQAGAIEN